MSEPGAVTIGPYREGEIPPPVVVTFKDANVAAIDLTGYSARWIYRRHASSGNQTYAATDPAAVTQTATVNADQVGHKGQVTYLWVSADFVTPGDYEGEMWVGNLTNRMSSIRYVWRVNAALAVPSI